MNYRKKVLQIIPDLGLGGAEIMVENLSIELIKNGYELIIISLYNHNSAITERLEKQMIPVYYFNKKKGFDWKLILKLLKFMKANKPDVVHTHLYAASYGMLAAIFARVPIRIHTIHSIASKDGSKLKRVINKLLFNFCDVVPVSISPVVKETVIKEYNLRQYVPMIYNGIDINKCIPKINYKNSDDRIKIIHVGNFKEAKNHIGLIESFRCVNKLYPDVVLNLIGTGDLENQIKNKVKEFKMEKNVIFFGIRANVHPLLNEADIFILPSLWEGMPISLIEAMATGLPIVATRVGGIPDMIDQNKNGLLVDTKIEEISSALVKLINNPKLREELGSKAKITAMQFSSKIMAEEYSVLYNSIS